MEESRRSNSSVETLSLDDPLPFEPGDKEPDRAPQWVWVLTTAEAAKHGIEIRAAAFAGGVFDPPPAPTPRRRAWHPGASVSSSSEPVPLPGPEEILNPDAVARVLDIPRKTVIFLCAEGRLEGAFKAGRQWRVPGRTVRKLAGFDPVITTRGGR